MAIRTDEYMELGIQPKSVIQRILNMVGIPAFKQTDANKVLAVKSSGKDVEWKKLTPELPSYEEGDKGKVLAVNSAGTGTEWITQTVELPAYSSADAGKVLSVDDNGYLVFILLQEPETQQETEPQAGE